MSELSRCGWDEWTTAPHSKTLEEVWYVPNRDLTIVVLTNDSLASPPDLADLAMRAVDTEKVTS